MGTPRRSDLSRAITRMLALLCSGFIAGFAMAAPRILLVGHSRGDSTPPSPGLVALTDTIPTLAIDHAILGGDQTVSGSGAQWDAVQAYTDTWGVPVEAVPGNHEMSNQSQFLSRFGSFYSTVDIGPLRLLRLNTEANRNNDLDDTQLAWLLSELSAAAIDPTVDAVLVAVHHLFWIMGDARYEEIVRLANGWGAEFSRFGYDQNRIMEDAWPAFVALAQAKPTLVFAGDVGNVGVVGLFQDVLDGVELVACGFSKDGDATVDAAVIAEFDGQGFVLESVSPWGSAFGAVQDYGPSYWATQYSEWPVLDPGGNRGPTGLDPTAFDASGFEMGVHVNPKSGSYTPTTGYSVSLSPFAMGVTEVELADYLDFLNARGSNDCQGKPCVDLGDTDCPIEELAPGGPFAIKAGLDPTLPISEVTWYGALEYCNHRSALDGLDPAYMGTSFDQSRGGWRLPTEAEFEFVLRSGNGSEAVGSEYFQFSWGDNSPLPAREHANYAGTAGADVYPGVAPVGSFAANSFGLHDLEGNLSEWVYDQWSESTAWPVSATDPVNAPNPLGLAAYRMIRGGSWRGHWSYLRNAYRSAELPDHANAYLGFRVARTLEGSVVATEPGEAIANLASIGIFPNPSRGPVQLRFELTARERLRSLSIVDARGRLVSQRPCPDPAARRGVLAWDGRDGDGKPLARGVYFAILATSEASYVEKITLID